MMDGFAVMLRKELLEAWRNQRFLVVGVIFLLLGIISPVGAKYLPELLKALGTGQQGVQVIVPTPTVNDAIAQFLKNVAGTGVFVALLLPMSAIAREKEQGTASFVLTKPVSRQAFLAAKALALFAVSDRRRGAGDRRGLFLHGAALQSHFSGRFSRLRSADPALAAGLCLVHFPRQRAHASAARGGGHWRGGLGRSSLLGILPNVGEYTPSRTRDSRRAGGAGQNAGPSGAHGARQPRLDPRGAGGLLALLQPPGAVRPRLSDGSRPLLQPFSKREG